MVDALKVRHLYAEVEEVRVLKILRESLGDLDRFTDVLRERFAMELGSDTSGT